MLPSSLGTPARLMPARTAWADGSGGPTFSLREYLKLKGELLAALPIYLYGAEILRKRANPVLELDDGSIELIQNMFETIHRANGIGLAANQVGVLERIVVLDLSEMEEGKDMKPMVLINPEVLKSSGEWSSEEGCLSIPEVRDIVKRPEIVTVRFKDGDFKEMGLEVRGLLGRVILHEIDHLNGILFTDHLSPSKRRVHKPKLDKIRRGEIDVNYPIALAETVLK